MLNGKLEQDTEFQASEAESGYSTHILNSVILSNSATGGLIVGYDFYNEYSGIAGASLTPMSTGAYSLYAIKAYSLDKCVYFTWAVSSHDSKWSKSKVTIIVDGVAKETADDRKTFTSQAVYDLLIVPGEHVLKIRIFQED